MNSLLYTLVVLALGNCVGAQLFNKKPCPTVTPVANYNETAFEGAWLEMSRYYNNYQTTDGCVVWGMDPSYIYYQYVKLINGAIDPQSDNGMSLNPYTSTGNGVFSNAFPWLNQDIVVLATDYTSYAVLYSCSTTYKFFKNEYVWVFQRNPTVTVNIDYAAIATASGVTVNPSALQSTLQVMECD